MDELFEALTLIQTGKIRNFPVIVFNKEYHDTLLQHLYQMKSKGTVSNHDLELLVFTDDIQQAKAFIMEQSIRRYGLKPKSPIRPFRWLFERSLSQKR